LPETAYLTKNDIKRELEKMIISFFHSPLFSISAQIAFPQLQPLKKAKPQSRQLKIHQNSLPTVTPDQLSHFF